MRFVRTLALFLGVIGAFYLGKYLYLKPGVSKGEIAPGFSAELKDGQDFQLNDLRGNYVLIDFWASWCGPCLQENPALVDLYRDFNAKTTKDGHGFEVLSIALETQPGRVERVISAQGLSWPFHIIQHEGFESELAKLYRIKSIPAKIFVGPDGKVISINHSLGSVRSYLEKRSGYE